VFGENGRWQSGTRTITDSHAGGWMSLADVIRESSNIGIVKFGARLRPGEQYRYLRDFGFGTPTGVEFPAESNGRLRRPAEWSRLSQASLAMGYELSVTPLQVAAAYGALANGGVLMEPHLLGAVRAGGRVVEEREPRALRRVVPEAVARAITPMLVAVVEDGTATHASLQTFRVAGKTGTARRTGAGGRYEAGSYTSSFAGYFPADDPQLVIFVKIDQPRGEYYGGLTAAPVTRETLQGILAARGSALDGQSLLATRLPTAAPAGPRRAPSAPAQAGPEGTYVFLLEGGTPAAQAPARREVSVPALAGLTLRDAARRAHAAGLRVRLRGGGRVASTEPGAGAALLAGDTLLLVGSDR
jgi:cell division protein FtsI (penicillin-binding protein 3)